MYVAMLFMNLYVSNLSSTTPLFSLGCWCAVQSGDVMKRWLS